MNATRGATVSGLSLAGALSPRLKPASARLVNAHIADLEEAAAEAGVADGIAVALASPLVRRFLGSVMEVSPFLRDVMLLEPKRLSRLLAAPDKVSLRNLLARIRRSWKTDDRDRIGSNLRQARREVALLCALADLGGVWDVDAVTAALSSFARSATVAACRFLLRQAADQGRLRLPDPSKPEVGSGWIVLAMGKFGAGELNYSSDIDLIVLFDEDVAPVMADHSAAEVFIALTKALAKLLQEHTEDGYVFRTDLRLRPDPGSTNVAISTAAALQYYESFGQNWERSAMIKARAVAGDQAAGDAFLVAVQPFIWRRYLDFAAIADIHSIKRQIHDHRGHADIAVAGHNVKLGRGGIREIEFFVQTQQLIAGGRHPELRGRRTVDMLDALVAGGWLRAATRREMAAAYRYLRMVEHCIQMVADEQAHTLPESDEALAVIGRMAGHASLSAFDTRLRKTLETVRRHYTALFESAPSLASHLGNLVFTGDDDDPDTLETLSRLGFQRPGDVIAAVRGWHYGRYPATRSATARDRLTEFVPILLEVFAGMDNADAAFLAFDRFLSRMPAGVQLFSLLQSNRGLLNLLSMMLSVAPRLAETVIERTHVLDALIEPSFFGQLPDRALQEKRLASSLSQAETYEEFLDRARIFNHEQSLLIGARVLAGSAGVARLGQAYSDLAEVILAAVFQRAREEFELTHGRIKGGRAVLVALGRLGGREMTAASDLDLIMLYDYAKTAGDSDGQRSLPGVQYFGRLTQRLLAALSAPTAEGTLYEVDFRLRPSGKSGPLATHVDSFRAYQKRGAWTWEHMALTRARVVAGDRRLVKRVEREIADAIMRERDRQKVVADVVEMRAMVEDAKGDKGAWDIKQTPGGLVDIEFIAQTLQLLHATRHPQIRSTETAIALREAVEAGVLGREDAQLLAQALALYQALIQILRLCFDGPVELEELPRGLRERLVGAAELPDFASLDADLRQTQENVRTAFERLIGPTTT